MTSRPSSCDSLWSTVLWWERRRFSYNAFLLIVGVPSLIVFFVAIELAHGVPHGEDAIEPFALVVCPLLANIAYTGGWMVERVIGHRVHGDVAGPRLMRAGLLFSLFVLLFPAVLWSGFATFELLSQLFHRGIA